MADSGVYPITVNSNVGTAILNVTVICNEKPAKIESLQSALIDFGTLRIGRSKTLTFNVINSGDTKTGISASGPTNAGIDIISVSPQEISGGASATITVKATCLSPYGNSTVDPRLLSSQIGVYGSENSISVPFQYRCIPDDRDVGGVASYSVSAAAGLCDYGQYNGDIKTPSMQFCGPNAGAAHDWVESHLTEVHQYWDNECQKEICTYEITDYQSPGSGFGDSRSRHIILHYR